jgi:serine/threonine protein kinase/predicted Zn-dependent protease
MDERSKAYLEAAVERGWVTDDQVVEVLRVAETVAEMGIDQKIEDILVKKGFVSPEQARQLSRELSRMKVGKYQILEKVGEGGAGIVYKANQEPLERRVAIKVLSSQRTQSPKYLERFLREARIAVTLNHQNIVRGLDYGESDGYHYFVMEFVEGESLFHVLEREGTLDENRALTIAQQVVAALEHASKYDLVHRDIKPENILLTRDQVVKVCDLGLAKPSLVETAAASKDGTTIGTPTYMSPEQIRGKDDADFRSDVYSLGATLYHMVTGQPPFSGESADILVRRHLRDAVTDPRELNLSLSSSTAAIVLKMLAKKPEDRYHSLSALEEDLTAVLEGRPPRNTIDLGRKRPSGTVHVDFDESAGRRTRIARSSIKSKLPIFVVVALLLIGGGIVAFLKPFNKEEPAPENENVAKVDEVKPKGPTPQELAKNAYDETVDWLALNGTATFEEKQARWKAVANRFPETKWALRANEQVADMVRDREAADRRHRTEAKSLFDQSMERSQRFLETRRYGDAIREMSGYPEGYENTAYPEKAKKEAERLSKAAKEDFAAALEKASKEKDAGRFDDAVALLEPFLGYGMREIEKTARETLDAIGEARKEEAAARAKGRLAFRATVGKALLRVARGEFREARNDLVQAQGKPTLTWFQDDLSRMDVRIREAARFDEALKTGAEELVGKVQRFQPAEPEANDIAGKVLAVNERGFRLSKSGGSSRDLPFVDLSGEELVRIAFFALDMDSAADHEAAAVSLIAAGRFPDADREIEAARILGADAAGIRAVKELFSEYLRDVAEEFVRKATLRMTQDRPEEAKEQLEQAVERAPWYGRPRFLMGQVYLRLGKPDQAVVELKRSLALGERDPEVHYYLGEAYFGLGRAGDALAAYTKFADIAENDGERLEKVRTRINELRAQALAERIEALTAEAKTAQRKKKWDRVIEIYREIRELDPEDSTSLYFLGKAYIETRDFLNAYVSLKAFLVETSTGRQASEAKKLVRHLTKTYRSATDTVAHVADANQQLNSGRLEGALTLCDVAIKDAPLNDEAYYTRALVHLKIGQKTEDDAEYEACLKDLRSVEVLNPEQPLVYECRALALYYLKRHEEGLRNADRAISKLPARWQAYNVAGLIHHEQGRDDKAIQILTKGIEKAPGIVLLYINRALSWETMKRYEKAIADINTARKCNPSAGQIDQLDRIFKRVIEAKRRED